jgi:two-component system cell cycle sensor histidine kinase/response regulator CckA
MRVLLIEDNADDADLTLAALRRFGFEPEALRVDTIDALTAAMLDQAWSVVISDYNLPGFNGSDALRIVRQHDREIPFLVVSGLVGEELAVEIIRNGANDYIVKDRLQSLGPAIERELRDVQLRHERRTFFEALRRSEDRYRRIFEKAPVGVATSTGEGDLVAVNERFASMLAYTAEEMIGWRLSKFTHPDDPPLALVQRRFEQRFLTKDEATVWTNVTAAPVLAADGSLEQIVWLIEDISEHKRQEQELRLRARQQTVIANLGHAALRGEPVDALLSQVVEAVIDLLGVDLCGVLREEDGRFRLVADVGWNGKEIERGEATMAAYTLRIDEPVVVDDLARETRFAPPLPLLARGVVSGVAVPISTGRVAAWGVLAVHSFAPRQFTVHDVGFLRAIATVLAQTLERDRVDGQLVLHAAQQSAIAELSRIALRSVDDAVESACNLLHDVLEVEYATFFDLDERAGLLRYRAGRCWRQSELMDIPLDSGSPIVLAIRENEVSMMTSAGTDLPSDGIAVAVAGTTDRFGVISAHAKHGRSFVETDYEFLQSVANILADAMERERSRDLLTTSRERYREVVEGASEVIFTLSPGGEILSLNAAFEQTTGWPVAEWIGRSCFDLVEMEDLERTRGLFEHLLAEQRSTTAEVRIRGRYGEVLLEITAFPKIESGLTRTIYGFARDITTARRAEEGRRQLTRSLQLLLESTVEGIVTIDPIGRCTMWNSAATEILGRSDHDMAGVTLHQLLHGKQCVDRDCAVKNATSSTTTQSVRNDVFLRGDGASIPVEYSAAPILDDGVPIGVVINFSDISDRRKLEAKLEQADRLSSLGRMAATIAHEFNNVLMGISPFVEVIRRGKNIEASLDHIGRAVKRGKRITEEILRFTRHAQPHRAPFDLDPWIDSIVLEATSLMPASCRIETIIRTPHLVIDGDANQLQQIFTNLILNARDAMPGGGKLTIEVGREAENARLPFGVLEHPERFAHCIVRDTGHGMSAETLRHIYEPLYTTKKNGTGLGLPVAHQVVQRHGGDIFVESEVGLGTTFHIFLPLSSTAVATLLEPVAAAADARHVLLVEDDVAVATGLTSLLEFEGIRVDVAETGAAAILALERFTPDVVVLDVGLPDMEGTNVYTLIAAKLPRLPVIFSTGHADRARLDEFLERPNTGYLLKPYEGTALLKAIQEVLS